MIKAPKKLCFVCTANICRSPFAQFYALLRLRALGLTDVEVDSAGVFAVDGRPATPEIIQIAREFDVDLSGHLSTSIRNLDLNDYRFVLCMERAHRDVLLREYPETAGRVYLLRSFAEQGATDRDIADPVGLSADFLRACFDDIGEAIEGLLKKW
jgi:protein-tyrosine phosphatase